MFRSVSTLVPLSLPLKNFVNCWKQFGFCFVDSDDIFYRLSETVKELNDDAINDNSILVCMEVVNRLAGLLGFQKRENTLLSTFLFESVSLFKLFGCLSNYSDVWLLAKENNWLGCEGIAEFYKQYENVTNVLLGEKSIESKVLDSLAPAIRFVSFLGEELKNSSFSDVFSKICSNESIAAHEKLSNDLFIVQTHIVQIQGWFTNGIDDLAAALNTHASILENGFYDCIIEENGSAVLSLSFKLDKENKTFHVSHLLGFVRHLGFIQHESEEQNESISAFIEEYSVLLKVVENLSIINLVGGKLNRVTYFPHRVASVSCSAASFKLQHSDENLAQSRKCCHAILQNNKYLQLFWIKELRNMGLLLFNTDPNDSMSILNLHAFSNFILCIAKRSNVSTESLRCVMADMNIKRDSDDVGWLPRISQIVHKCIQEFELSPSLVRLPMRTVITSVSEGTHVHTIAFDEGKKEEVTTRLLCYLFSVSIFSPRLNNLLINFDT